MKPVTSHLISIFKPVDMDWMGYKLNNPYDLSFHHIIKRENGGSYNFDNGALLKRDTSHEYLHIIEGKDLDMYVYINKILKEINTQRNRPTKKQLFEVEDVLLEFEKEHCSDTNNKGKPLIKERYIERRFR